MEESYNADKKKMEEEIERLKQDGTVYERRASKETKETKEAKAKLASNENKVQNNNI